MNKTFSILLLVVFLAPAFTFAQDATSTTDVVVVAPIDGATPASTSSIAVTPTEPVDYAGNSQVVKKKKKVIKKPTQKTTTKKKIIIKKKKTSDSSESAVSNARRSPKSRTTESGGQQGQDQGQAPKLPELTLTSDQLSCLRSALTTREDANNKAHTDGLSAVRSARSTFIGSVVDAYGKTGGEQKAALATAQNTLRETILSAEKASKESVKSAGEAFKTTMKDTCNIANWPEDKGPQGGQQSGDSAPQGSDSQGQNSANGQQRPPRPPRGEEGSDSAAN